MKLYATSKSETEGYTYVHQMPSFLFPGENEEGLREPFEPEEGDLTTEDHRVFWSQGKVAFAVGEDEDWRPAAREWMDRERFWPNVWLISDHGNAHLLGASEEPSK